MHRQARKEHTVLTRACCYACFLTCLSVDMCVCAAAFENIVQALYSNVVPKPKSECSKTEQLGVSFAAGYLAGILCAVISHPADNLVSKLNSSKVCVPRSSQAADSTHGLRLRSELTSMVSSLEGNVYMWS